MQKLEVYSKSVESMTSNLDVHIVLKQNEKAKANLLIDAAYTEADRLIAIISAWQEGTELFIVNEHAGICAIKVGEELYQLVKRSIYLSEITDGLFDVTFASIDKIWYFDKPIVTMPAHKDILNSIQNINYKFIELDDANRTIFIKNKGTKIELGAIGKGFIAHKMKLKLQSLGVEAGLISAGGDMTCWGESIREDGFWRIGVTDPNKEVGNIAWIPIKNESIATSGNYERFAILNGEKYSHILNPKTGYPVKGIKSVTLMSLDAELCDAIATTIFLMGVKKGLDFVNQFNDIRCFIVAENNQYFFSSNFNAHLIEHKELQLK